MYLIKFTIPLTCTLVFLVIPAFGQQAAAPIPFTIPPPRPPVPTPGSGNELCGNGQDANYLSCLQTTRANQTDNCFSLQEKQGLPYFKCMCESFCPIQGFAYQMEDAQRITFCSAADLSQPRKTTTTGSGPARTFDNSGNNDLSNQGNNNLAKPTNRGTLAPVANSGSGEETNSLVNMVWMTIGSFLAAIVSLLG